MSTSTNEQYDQVIKICKNTFLKKTLDYGTSWRVYRIISVADQIYIKAKRIRTIQEKKIQRIGDDIKSEFEGILNYSIVGLIQLQIDDEDKEQLPVEEVENYYDGIVLNAKNLMHDKNHDYGEAWRKMRVSSITDLILMKLLRVKQIEDNNGTTIISEGIDANYYDMINYSVFALIKLNEN